MLILPSLWFRFLTRKKKYKEKNLEISGQNKKQLKCRFHVKKTNKQKNGKELCLNFQERDLEMSDLCKHLPCNSYNNKL